MAVTRRFMVSTGVVAVALLCAPATVAAAAPPAAASSSSASGAVIPLGQDSFARRHGTAAPRPAVSTDPSFQSTSGPGYNLEDNLRDRGNFTIRLVSNGQGNVENLRSSVLRTASQLSEASGVSVLVAPGTIPDQAPDRVGGFGEILISIDGSSPCGQDSAGAIGCGGYDSYSDGTTSYYTVQVGRAWIYPSVFNPSSPNHLDQAQLDSLVAHELGHAVGLAHYDGTFAGHNQVMSSILDQTTYSRNYQAGDRNGLRALFPLAGGYKLADPGAADYQFTYLPGVSGTRLMCDWFGTGTDVPVVVSNGRWYVRSSRSTGPPTLSFGFGSGRDEPICGDWNGDGRDTPGVRQGRLYLLTNGSSGGGVAYRFIYGPFGGKVVVGNWDRSTNGSDGVGIASAGKWYLTDALTGRATRSGFSFGSASAKPVVGDWDGDGGTGIGAVGGGTWTLRNTPGPGTVSYTYRYGLGTDTPLAGNWSTADRKDGIGIYR